MNRQSLLLIGLLALILWLLALCSPKPLAPASDADPTATSTLAPLPTDPPTTPGYHAIALQMIPQESIVHFSIPFMGSAVSGQLGVKEGIVTLIESETGTHVRVEMYIDMTSINTGTRLLDNILHRLLQVEEYPTALFTGEALDALPGLYPRGALVFVAMPAELRIVNEIVSKTVDTEAVLHERHMEVTATFSVTLREIGATPPLLVGDHIDFRVEIVTR